MYPQPTSSRLSQNNDSYSFFFYCQVTIEFTHVSAAWLARHTYAVRLESRWTQSKQPEFMVMPFSILVGITMVWNLRACAHFKYSHSILLCVCAGARVRQCAVWPHCSMVNWLSWSEFCIKFSRVFLHVWSVWLRVAQHLLFFTCELFAVFVSSPLTSHTHTHARPRTEDGNIFQTFFNVAFGEKNREPSALLCECTETRRKLNWLSHTISYVPINGFLTFSFGCQTITRWKGTDWNG